MAGKYIDILNTIWVRYEIPEELELPDLDSITEEEIAELIVDNDLEYEYMYETSTDIFSSERVFAIDRIKNYPTVEILDKNFNTIYDNGNQKS